MKLKNICYNQIMNNAIILHGQSGTPNQYWYPWIAQELQKNTWDVWAPQLPNPDKPILNLQLPFVIQNGQFNENTVLIGHSSGAALALSVMESMKTKIRRTILVAGFIQLLSHDEKDILKQSYDWELIKKNCDDLIFINSDNDPWGYDDTQGRLLFEKLGGTLIIRHGEGHMGSEVMKQPYNEFPLLLKLIQ